MGTKNHPLVTEFPLVLISLDPLLSRAGEELAFTALCLNHSAFGSGSPELQTLAPSKLFNGRKYNNVYFHSTLASILVFKKQSFT